jgi:hypothetical protein
VARGIYRTRTPDSDAEYAFVDYGQPSNIGQITRALYETRRIEPPFDKLPTKAEFEALNAKDPKGEKRRPM